MIWCVRHFELIGFSQVSGASSRTWFRWNWNTGEACFHESLQFSMRCVHWQPPCMHYHPVIIRCTVAAPFRFESNARSCGSVFVLLFVVNIVHIESTCEHMSHANRAGVMFAPDTVMILLLLEIVLNRHSRCNCETHIYYGGLWTHCWSSRINGIYPHACVHSFRVQHQPCFCLLLNKQHNARPSRRPSRRNLVGVIRVLPNFGCLSYRDIISRGEIYSMMGRNKLCAFN